MIADYFYMLHIINTKFKGLLEHWLLHKLLHSIKTQVNNTPKWHSDHK